MTDATQNTTLDQALDAAPLANPMPADAVGDAAKSQALQTVLRFKNNKSDDKLRKAMPLMKRAVRLINEEKYREAAQLGLQAVNIDENLSLACHITAIALDKLGVASLALGMYERALQLSPEEPEIYQNLGLLAWRMDLYDVAEKFFRIFCRMMPEPVEGPNNLACVLRDKGEFESAIEVLRAAIYENQESSLLWNSLGTVMMEQTEFDNAVLFYEQALQLEPNLARAYHNIGYCRATEGRHDIALEHLQKALDLGVLPANERAETEHAIAISLIGSGQLDKAWDARVNDLPFDSKEEAIIMASIIEKETGVSGERGDVAGVFTNRLRKGMPLQTDPTVIYAITGGKHKNDGKGPLGRRLLRKDMSIDSAYNTYKYPGLPKGPICNPGKASIEAALNPASNDYIYFVADGSGGHIFAKTLAEHNKNVAQWRKIRRSQ